MLAIDKSIKREAKRLATVTREEIKNGFFSNLHRKPSCAKQRKHSVLLYFAIDITNLNLNEPLNKMAFYVDANYNNRYESSR